MKKAQEVHGMNKIGTCEHCGKTMSLASLGQWHGDNCSVVKPRVLTKRAIGNPTHKTCQHCLKEVRSQTYGRAHGERCKHRFPTVPMPKYFGRGFMKYDANKIRDIAEMSRKVREETKTNVYDIIECPYCDVESNMVVMARWHGNKCKHKNSPIKTFNN